MRDSGRNITHLDVDAAGADVWRSHTALQPIEMRIVDPAGAMVFQHVRTIEFRADDVGSIIRPKGIQIPWRQRVAGAHASPPGAFFCALSACARCWSARREGMPRTATATTQRAIRRERARTIHQRGKCVSSIKDLDRFAANPSLRLSRAPEHRVIFFGTDQFRDELLYSNIKGRNPL